MPNQYVPRAPQYEKFSAAPFMNALNLVEASEVKRAGGSCKLSARSTRTAGSLVSEGVKFTANRFASRK